MQISVSMHMSFYQREYLVSEIMKAKTSAMTLTFGEKQDPTSDQAHL